MTILNEPVVTPGLEDLMKAIKSDVFKTLNVAKIGKIQKVDLERKTLEAEVVFKRLLGDNQVRAFPLLIDIPFVTIQGGGVALQVPISPGDDCLLIFADRNIDSWFRSGGVGVPFDGRAHDASDGIAIVGINSLAGTLPDNPDDEGRLISGDAKVGVTKDGTESFVKQGDGEVSVDEGLVRIKSATRNLLTLTEGLIDVLKALTVQDPVSGPIPLTAASITSLEAQKALFEELLTT